MMKNKFLSVIIMVCIAVSLATVTAFAEDTVAPDELAAAVAAAKDGDTIALGVGEYTLPNFSDKDINFTGVEGTVFKMKTQVVYARSGSNLTFTGITFKYANANYQGIQCPSVVYTDCTFEGQPFLYCAEETFNNCTFNQTSNNAYNLWTYGAIKITLNDCIFNSAGKCILAFQDGSDNDQILTLNDCVLNASEAVEGKAAVEIDSSLLSTGSIQIDLSCIKTNGFAKGSVSENTVYNGKAGNLHTVNIIHEAKFLEKVEPVTHQTDGVKAHWYCEECEQYYTDEELVNAVAYEDLLIPCGEHSFAAVAEVAATYEAEGVAAHFACEGCGELRLTEDGQAVKGASLVLPRLEKEEPKTEEKKEPEKKVENPATDDIGNNVPLFIAMALTLAILFPVTLKKAKLNK